MLTPKSFLIRASQKLLIELITVKWAYKMLFHIVFLNGFQLYIFQKFLLNKALIKYSSYRSALFPLDRSQVYLFSRLQWLFFCMRDLYSCLNPIFRCWDWRKSWIMFVTKVCERNKLIYHIFRVWANWLS